MSDGIVHEGLSGAFPPAAQGVPAGSETLDLRHHMGILRRRWLAIAAIAVAVLSAAVLYAFKTTPTYEGRARLRIETRLPQVTPFEPAQEVRDQGFLSTEILLITSRAVLEKALQDDRLATIFPSGDERSTPTGLLGTVSRQATLWVNGQPTRGAEPWERLRGAVKVEPVRDTNLVDVSVQSTEPSACALVANIVAHAYVDWTIQQRQKSARGTLATLGIVRKEQEAVLGKAEDALLQFREQAPLPQLGGEDPGSVVRERLQALEEEHTSVQLQRIELEAAVQALDEAGAGRSDPQALMKVKALRQDQLAMGAYDRLLQLQQSRDVALQTYGPKHPQVAALDEQINNATDRFDEAVEYAADSLRSEHKALLDRESKIKETLDQQTALVVEADKESHRYDRLRRDVDRQSKVFDAIVDRMSEVDLTDKFEITNVSVAQEAVPPRMPVSPDRRRIILLGLLLGLMLGVGFAYGLEFLDDTVKAPNDVEQRLGAPWLGYVPRIKSRKTDTAALAERMRYVIDHPEDPVADAFRSIRTSIHFSAPSGGLKSLAVTSTVPQEGKTVVAANLAASFALSGRKVLLVDADMRRAMVHRALGLRRKRGLADMIVNALDVEEVVQEFPTEGGRSLANLSVLSVGTHGPNPSELLGSHEAAAIMEALHERYDMVVYDGPPAAFVADMAPLAHRCDGVLLVVRAARCRRSVALRALRTLSEVGAHITGVALNDVSPHMLRAYGHQGYYYHHAYGWQYVGEEEEEEAPAGAETPESAV